MEQYTPFPKRKSTRIPNYDYSVQNHYFVTVCTFDKRCIFANGGELTPIGTIAKEEMEALDNRFENIHMDKFVVMPNHVHAIIVMEMDAPGRTTLSSVVGSYKSGVTRKVRTIEPNLMVWQRSFHDHIIRNQNSYEKIWNYIEDNPRKWNEDCFYRV